MAGRESAATGARACIARLQLHSDFSKNEGRAPPGGVTKSRELLLSQTAKLPAKFLLYPRLR